MPGLLEVLGRNYSRNNEAVRAFEIGNTFMVNLLDEKDLPTENTIPRAKPIMADATTSMLVSEALA